MTGIEKQLMLKEIKEKLENKDIFFTNFSKVNVKDLGRLRQAITKGEGKGIVVKNNVARIVLKELGMENTLPAIDGSVFLVVSDEEPQKISKVLVNFAKEQEAFTIKGAFLDGNFHPSIYVLKLAALPSRNELLALVVGSIKAPINNFVLGLHGVLRSFVVVLNEMSKKKGEYVK